MHCACIHFCIYLCMGGLWDPPKKVAVKCLGDSPKVAQVHTNSTASDIENKPLESRSVQQSYYQMQYYIIFINRTKLFNVNL